MRLLTALLLLSTVSLFADTSDRIPGTRKSVPVRTPKRVAPRPAGRPKVPAKGGAVAHAFKRPARSAASSVRTKASRKVHVK